METSKFLHWKQVVWRFAISKVRVESRQQSKLPILTSPIHIQCFNYYKVTKIGNKIQKDTKLSNLKQKKTDKTKQCKIQINEQIVKQHWQKTENNNHSWYFPPFLTLFLPINHISKIHWMQNDKQPASNEGILWSPFLGHVCLRFF